MVMTQQMTPRLTIRGAALVCLLAAGSWLVAPTLACPPDKTGDKVKAPKPKDAKPMTVVRVKPPKAPQPPTATRPARVRAVDSRPERPARPPRAPRPPRAGTTQPESTFESFMRNRDRDREDMSLEQRILKVQRTVGEVAGAPVIHG